MFTMGLHGFDSSDLNHETSTHLLRGLKGGSGGGGGGSGGGGFGGGGGGRGGYSGGSRGSYYGTSTSSSVSDGTMPTWGIITIIVAAVLGTVCCFVYYIGKKEVSNRSGFEEAVSKARTQQNMAPASSMNESIRFETYAGDFDVKYSDRGKVHDGYVNMKLINAGSWYTIGGECSDADGSATITEIGPPLSLEVRGGRRDNVRD